MIFSAITLLAMAVVAVPLFWNRKTAPVESGVFDVAVYRDQLAELDRDVERGVIDAGEAGRARNEISRRLLAAEKERKEKSEKPETAAPASMAVMLAGLVMIPVVAGLFYARLGRPDLPDAPQTKRLASALKTGDINAMVFQVEKALQKRPDDIRGWSAIAPVYMRLRRYDDAANAYGEILRLRPPDPETLTSYAEAVLLSGNTKMMGQVKRALKTAISLDGKYAKARFYWALVLQQEGNRDEALAQWRKLLAQSGQKPQLKAVIQQRIAELTGDSGKIQALNQEQRKAAADMTPEQRRQMIASMVERLAGRLKENGNDLDGWLKLLRVRMVLGQKDKAVAALAAAKNNFTGNAAALKRLDDAATALGLKNN